MIKELFDTLLFSGIVIWTYMTFWFLVSLIIKRNDVADFAWGLGFVVVSISSFIKLANYTFTSIAITSLVVIWGLRLSSHIGSRNLKKSEDSRYKVWRDTWGKWFILRSYLQVYILQGFLMLVIVSPVLIVYTYPKERVSPLVILSILIWIFGFIFEVVSDNQLKKFVKNREDNKSIMKSGLWKYSRHPNYFGEITQWWAIGIIAFISSYGWLSIAGPLTITFLIVFVSGIPMLENKYSDREEFQEYKKHTSKLIPLPPNK